MIKRFVVLLAALCAPAIAAAQTAPAEMGITPTTLPEVLQVLDNTKTWTPIGTVDPTTHTFTLIGGGGSDEADILVTDPAVGMVPVTATLVTDNSPFAPNLMNMMGPPISAGGYDVTWPARKGQNFTEYYYSHTLVLSRGANYHCSGTTLSPQTVLVFPPGIDNVIQEAYNMSGGGAAWGRISGCRIFSQGFGHAIANPITPTQLTNVSFQGDPAGLIPNPPWNVGDGIIGAAGSSVVPQEAILPLPPGTTIGAVAGNTLTLANGQISPSLGYTTFPHSTAAFTETGTNNFANNDTIQVGSITYKFLTAAFSTATPVHTVQIGKDFPTSAANLVAAIMSGNGEWVTYVPDGSGSPNGYAANPEVTASYAAGVITFTSIYGGPNVNTFPSIYAGTGSAGAFGGATFTGANDATTCPAPCTASNITTFVFYQLPGPNSPSPQVFLAQTTIGSPSVTVISGPRLLEQGDTIVSDAFPFGTTVSTATNAFPQTVRMTRPTNDGAAQNATVTHAPGAEGNLWVMAANLKRRTLASASNNLLVFAPLGLDAPCSSVGVDVICGLQVDEGNSSTNHLFGRWLSGNNTSPSISMNEQFTANYVADVFDGSTTFGTGYVNPNTNSGEGGTAKWGMLKNCVNGNSAVVFTGYMTFGSAGFSPNAANGCANITSVYPPTPGGAMGIGTAPANGPYLAPNTNGIGAVFNAGFGSVQVKSGNDSNICLWLNGAPSFNSYVLGWGAGGCSVNPTWVVGWDTINNRFSINNASGLTPVMSFLNPQVANSYIGSGNGVAFTYGAILGGDGNSPVLTQSRLFGMANAKPAATWHAQGDTEINTLAPIGGQAAWYLASFASNSPQLSAPVVAGTTTSVAVNTCPTPTPAAGTLVVDNSQLPPLALGTFLSCTTGPNTLNFQAAALRSGNSSDFLKFVQWYGAAPVSNDPANPDYTATTIRSGSASNKDITGLITLAGGTATLSLVGAYGSAPICLCQQAPASSGVAATDACTAFETVTNVTFTGTGTDKIKYHCIGRN